MEFQGSESQFIINSKINHMLFGFGKYLSELLLTSRAVIFILFYCIVRMYTVDVRCIYFVNFLELALLTILKLFYTKTVIFNNFWSFCIFPVLPTIFYICICIYVFHIPLCESRDSLHTNFQFLYIGLLWPDDGTSWVETSCCLINIFIKIYWF